jgi:D-sedoheptulose 7-phosphate isomerase
VSNPRRERIAAAFDESIAVKQAARDALSGDAATAAGWIVDALAAGGKLLVAGNGGSAADAQHIAAELVGRFTRDRQALSAVALTTDSSVLTSLANDLGAETMFARQVEALGRAGDVLLVLSTSGASANVVAALRIARETGLRTIALTGAAGNAAAEHSDLALRVPSESTARIQETHITLAHAICELVEEALAP